jgi:hypothetical protein
MLAEDTTPGKVLVLSVLANAPLAAGFVLVPLFSGGDRNATLGFVPYVLWVTPPLALGAIYVYARAQPDRRRHRAARVGLLLAVVALAMWTLVLALTLFRPGPPAGP